jgi:hypothetical protein
MVDFEDDDSLDPHEDLDATDIFVDRGGERERFHLVLLGHRVANARGGNDPVDTRAPRRNVLVFYGEGGYGKSKLSKKLEKDLAAEQEPLPARERIARARVSFDSGWDFETILLAIRAALQEHGPMPAFDIVLSQYWSEKGLEPRSVFESNTVLHRVAGALELPDQFSTSLEMLAEALVGASVVGSTAASLLKTIYAKRREKRRKKTLVEDCPFFLRLFENAAEDAAISHFPRLLAWELHRRDISLVVFMDEFEVLTQDSYHTLERWMNRLVWSMPNAFFVVTGRDRIDWGDPDCPRELPVTGPRRWPGLALGATTEPTQHLVDRLSDSDAEDFLCKKVRSRDSEGGAGEPAIPLELRRVIVKRAEGWPLYLDLAVDLFKDMRDDGQEPSPDDFEPGLDKLVGRIARDLSHQQREVLRAMSLLERFDIPLAAAAAAQPEGVAMSLARRALVREDQDSFWPYYLGGPITSCVRKASTWPGAWTEGDCAGAARRTLSELGGRHERARKDHDRAAVINYLNLGIRLAHDYNLDLDWIVGAARDYVSDYVWEPTLSPRVPPAEHAADIWTAAQALGLALIAIRERQEPETGRAQTISALERCLGSEKLEGGAHDLVAYFRAECLRDLARPAEAEQAMADLVGDGRLMNLDASEGLIYQYRRHGLFARAQEAIDALPDVPLRWRLQGDIHWNHARCADADASYGKSCALAAERELIGQHAEAEASRAFALGFEGGAAAEQSIERARELLKRARIKWADLQAANAELLVLAGTSSDVSVKCTEAMRAGERAQLSSITAYAALAAAFDAAVREDRDALAAARTAIARLVDGRHFHYLLEIVGFWTETPASAPTEPQAEWLDGIDATAARWRDVVDARRSQRSGAS